MRRGVILIKDNLAKHNWQGDKTCSFCYKPEIIRHLFFDCWFARMVWGVIFLALGVPKPHSVSHMFGHWMGGFAKGLRSIALLGAATTVWSLWMNRNDFVFEKKTIFFSFAGYLCYLPLAPYMGCAAENKVTNYYGGGYATIGDGD